MKLIYKYDSMTKKFIGTDEIADNATAPTNATLVPVTNDCYDPKFDAQTQTWQGISEEEYFQALKQQAEANQNTHSNNKPTQAQQLLMNQQTTITNLQKELDKQKDTTSQLKQLVMDQQAAITQLKKGSN